MFSKIKSFFRKKTSIDNRLDDLDIAIQLNNISTKLLVKKFSFLPIETLSSNLEYNEYYNKIKSKMEKCKEVILNPKYKGIKKK